MAAVSSSIVSSSIVSSLLLLAALLALLSSPTAARPGLPFHPCNTLFITYTVSTTTSSSLDASEVGEAVTPGRISAFISIYRVVAPFRTSYVSDGDRPRLMWIRRPEPLLRRDEIMVPSERELGSSSLRVRAKDILVVLVGLLFGVGCGALTAATMYLVWLIVFSREETCGAEDYEDEDEEDVENIKKVGYQYIPADEPAKVKESYEGN